MKVWHFSADSLDDCGLRFLLAMKHHSYLLLCLPLAQRAALQKKGIDSSMIVWAFHSESEEEMLQLVPSYEKGDTKWSELRELGAGWWLCTHTVLRVCIERVSVRARYYHFDLQVSYCQLLISIIKSLMLYLLY